MPSTPRSSPLALTVLSLLHYQPLHPYGIQQLVRRWGKDEVVNVAQRTTLYRTIDRLEKDGLIRAAEVNRNHRYPERTIYEVTDAGRQTAREWMRDMLAVPKAEYPEFPAALSNLLLLDRAEMVEVLTARRDALHKLTDEASRSIKSAKRIGLPRITSLESEYSLAMYRAELKWVDQLVGDLESGSLDWNDDELRAIADQLTTTPG